MTQARLERWHEVVRRRDSALLDEILDEHVVFHSPVVHTPQEGREITRMYLMAAMHVLNNETFRYLREVEQGDNAVLEFQTEIDGILINGVDMIRWNDAGRIIDFKVMVRPLKAIQKVHAMMAEMLEKR